MSKGDRIRTAIGIAVFIVIAALVILGVGSKPEKGGLDAEKDFQEAVSQLSDQKRDQFLFQARTVGTELQDAEWMLIDLLSEKRELTEAGAKLLLKTVLKILQLNEALNKPDFFINEKTDFSFLIQPIPDNNLELQLYLFLILSKKRAGYDWRLGVVNDWLMETNIEFAKRRSDDALVYFFHRVKNSRKELKKLFK